jgi:hypothetical protein
MFKFFGLGRSKIRQAGRVEISPDASGLTQQPTDIQRELVGVVLKDTLRLHGIPATWIGCEVNVLSRKSRTMNVAAPANTPLDEDLFVHLVILKWNEALLRFAPAFERQLIEGLDRFEPHIDHSKYIVSWRFSPTCGCPQTRMPNPKFWQLSESQPAAQLQARDLFAPLATVPMARPTPAPAPVALAVAAPKPKFDLPPSEMDNIPSAFAPTEPGPLR